jgi:hypothetical protein
MSVTLQRLSTRLVSALLIALVSFTFALTPPVHAETAGQRSTRNIILAGAALAAAIILYNNYHHKQVAHDTVVGRTADGGIVYADGRIVYPDGTVVYTSNNGRTPCTYDGYGTPCGPYARAYRVASTYEDEQPVYYRDADDQRVYYRDGDEHQVYYRDGDEQQVYYREVGPPAYRYQPVYRYRQNGGYRQAYYRNGDQDAFRGGFGQHPNNGHHNGNAKHRQADGG